MAVHQFREIEMIGAGAFGKTALVEDQTRASRRVVIKVPLTEEPVPPKKLNPKIDDALNDPIMHGFEKSLDRRFHRAEDMLAALAAYLRVEALQLGLGRQGPYAEALLRNWKAGRG